ncbi:hypothetical protein Pmani_027844 [Petrolisthes manimaculis]|uniref:Cytochrome P450 302a1, mitochondrial n=1 Tax=Petrolisthes manimaculis TaxID=1843537 RepID=A0AAE1P2X8_9EUCA|nr:hypothetical protein Pmani_027844 [Petrolisthes manimaculis]
MSSGATCKVRLFYLTRRSFRRSHIGTLTENSRSLHTRPSQCPNAPYVSPSPPRMRESEKDDDDVKPFEDIPGPRSLPIIGTLHHYLPGIGQYSFSRLHHTGLRKLQQFGPIVREQLIGGVTLLLLYDPQDIEVMYAREGRYPMRRSHTALEKYRLDRPNMYNNGGLLPTNGEVWWDVRRRAQRVLSRPPCVQSRLPHVNKVCQEFTEVLDELKSPQTDQVGDFLNLERRLLLELTMVATLDVGLGCLQGGSGEGNEEAEALMTAAHESNSTILGTDNGLQLWRLINTPLYRRLIKGQDTIYRIAQKYVEAKEAELKAEGWSVESREGPLSVLEYCLLESGLDKKDIIGVFCDTLLAGIDTGAFTLSYVLYNLACNPDKQEVLAQEAKQLLDATGGEVTPKVISEARYLKAVLRETYRLRPVSIGVGRIMQDDTVIRRYKVPKGTVVVTQNQVSCRLPQYFPEPDTFLPERWLIRRSTTHTDAPHPYLVLPFGHGPRACIGRRMAEQNLHVIILQLMWKYHVGWDGGELDCVSNLINEPDGPLLFTFHPRN